MVKCTECLSDNPEGSAYCNHCGRRLFVQQPKPELSENIFALPTAAQMWPDPPPPATPQPEPNRVLPLDDSIGARLFGLILGVLLFAVIPWAVDWSRFYPMMTVLAIADGLLIVVLSAHARMTRPDFLSYAGRFALFVFPITTLISLFYAGLFLARRMK